MLNEAVIKEVLEALSVAGLCVCDFHPTMSYVQESHSTDYIIGRLEESENETSRRVSCDGIEGLDDNNPWGGKF